jgi:hypothetical protein
MNDDSGFMKFCEMEREIEIHYFPLFASSLMKIQCSVDESSLPCKFKLTTLKLQPVTLMLAMDTHVMQTTTVMFSPARRKIHIALQDNFIAFKLPIVSLTHKNSFPILHVL